MYDLLLRLELIRYNSKILIFYGSGLIYPLDTATPGNIGKFRRAALEKNL